MRFFFSVGEPSGDLHGANLIAELRRRDPAADFQGLGGPRMQAAGCSLVRDMTDLAVMGVTGVIRQLPTFWRLLREVRTALEHARPDAVVLIDYPGFNWHVARAARQAGVPVFYYGAPQMWAWAGWRIRKMRRLVDHVLCKLPFEQAWYQQRGCRAEYVGHPYFDELHARRLDESFMNRLRAEASRWVAVLPGSRTAEVRDNLPAFAKAAAIVRRQAPDVRFGVACLHQRHAELARELLGDQADQFSIFAGRTPELIETAQLCLACSGSVSLELLHHLKPSVIHYHVRRWKYAILSHLVHVKYITLVNLLAMPDRFDRGGYDPDAPGAERTPFPEYPTWRDESARMARHALTWLQDPAAYAAEQSKLRAVKAELATSDASRKAADYIHGVLRPATTARRAA